MPRTMRLRLSKQAEKFVEALEAEGLTEQDVVGKALYLLQQVWETGRVAMLNDPSSESGGVAFVFRVGRGQPGLEVRSTGYGQPAVEGDYPEPAAPEDISFRDPPTTEN